MSQKQIDDYRLLHMIDLFGIELIFLRSASNIASI